MKTTIRQNTFETNSSSVHSLILIPFDVASEWLEAGEDWWLDLRQVEREAVASGSGYGDSELVQAPARTEHLVSKTELEEAGEWNEGVSIGIISQDIIDANWKLPVDILVCPDKYMNDSWCNVVAFSETDEGYVVAID